ncbi:PFTB repeat-containing protein [Hirschfeldia incana]|nr:PFTB repeat-containing protein [Hirschfeldia incana]
MKELQSMTMTQREQFLVFNDVFRIYRDFDACDIATQKFTVEIQRDKQLDYLTNGLRQLGPSLSSLDANRPWLCYWILHSIALLGESVDDELENNIIDFLGHCQGSDGGYGGGPGQLAHLGTSYAAVNSLVTLGGDKALSSTNRVHDMGEMDVRACYLAISIASILNIVDDELTRGLGDYILSCQTYEGGIGGEPGSEAHAGNTYCGLATMALINEVDRLNLDSLMNWVVHQQGVEMGFHGRTNKLVDGCYTFWQAAPCVLLQRFYSAHEEHARDEDDPEHSDDDDSDEEGNEDFRRVQPVFDSLNLQRYVILCSMVPEGGFRDKPGKPRDFYHTCYCLSGLSVAQHARSKDKDTPLNCDILGGYANHLEPVHLLHNVVMDRYNKAIKFFHRVA